MAKIYSNVSPEWVTAMETLLKQVVGTEIDLSDGFEFKDPRTGELITIATQQGGRIQAVVVQDDPE